MRLVSKTFLVVAAFAAGCGGGAAAGGGQPTAGGPAKPPAAQPAGPAEQSVAAGNPDPAAGPAPAAAPAAPRDTQWDAAVTYFAETWVWDGTNWTQRLTAQPPGRSGHGLSYDAATDTYTYVWKTQKSWSGRCGTAVVAFTDGTTHTFDVRFKS